MSISNSKLILNTVKTVVLDDAFMIASVSAKRARDVCVILNEWMKIPETLNDFAEQFVSVLKSCIPTGKRKNVDKFPQDTAVRYTFKKLLCLTLQVCCFST